jgi:hypothetical protein
MPPTQLVQRQPIIEPEPNRVPVEGRLAPVMPAIPAQAYPLEVGVYESSYVQVPTNAPTINKSDDFRSTLQKIDEQLAVSRKMFPN